MKKAKDYWIPIFEEFIRLNPQYTDEDIIEWYPSGQMEIMVKTKDGNQYIYDCNSKNTIFLNDIDEECEETEEEWRKRFARTLCRKMRTVGISQEQLSEITKISKVTLSKYVNCKGTPNGHNISKLSRALKCSPSELMSGE